MEPSHRNFLIAAAVITILCSVLRLAIEPLFQLFKLKECLKKEKEEEEEEMNSRYACKSRPSINLEYLKSPANYIEIPMYILSIVFVSIFVTSVLNHSHVANDIDVCELICVDS